MCQPVTCVSSGCGWSRVWVGRGERVFRNPSWWGLPRSPAAPPLKRTSPRNASATGAQPWHDACRREGPVSATLKSSPALSTCQQHEGYSKNVEEHRHLLQACPNHPRWRGAARPRVGRLRCTTRYTKRYATLLQESGGTQTASTTISTELLVVPATATSVPASSAVADSL